MITLSSLSEKDVISISTGRNIGQVDDIEFCKENAMVKYLIVFGRPKLFGLLGRGKDIRIPWDDVVVIGEDAVLINKCIIEDEENKKIKINFE